MNAIYLASGSPRRREILENLGFTVRRLPADIDETPKEGEAAVEYVRRMACEKNQAAVDRKLLSKTPFTLHQSDINV